jgi:hypothetical protein
MFHTLRLDGEELDGMLREDPFGAIWLSSRRGTYRIEGNRADKVSDDDYSEWAMVGHRAILVHRSEPDHKDRALETVDLDEYRRTRVWRPTILPFTGAGKIDVDRNGHAWFGCGAGLCEAENPTDPKTRVRTYGVPDGLPSGDWFDVAVDSSGRVWARDTTEKVRLYFRDTQTRRFEALPPDQDLGNGGGIEILGGKVVWAGGSSGLLRRDGSAVQFYPARRFELFWGIDPVFHDTGGDLWLGLPDGPVRVAGGMNVSVATKDQGVPVAIAIARSKMGDLYVGTPRGTLRWDGSRWIPVAGVEKINVSSIEPRPDGSVTIFGRATEVFVARANEAHAARPAEYRSAGITPLLFQGKLSRLGNIGEHDPVPEGIEFPSDPVRIRSAVTDSHGNVWFCTMGGLFVTDLKGRWRRLTHDDGLLQTTLQTIGAAPDGSMWIGYDLPVGFSRLESFGPDLSGPPRFRHFITHYTYVEGTFFWGFDSQGRVWRGKGGGIDVSDGVHLDPADWVHLDHDDGLAGDDQGPNAFYLDRDGSAWTGSDKGLTHFESTRDLLQVRTVKLSGSQYPLSAAGRSGVHISLGVSPVALARKVQVQYRVLPSGPVWQTANDLDFDLPALSGGHHRLEARVVGTHWIRPENEAVLEWDTAWEISAWWWLLGVPALGAPSYWWNKRRTKKRYLRLREIYDQVQSSDPGQRQEILGRLPAALRKELEDILAEAGPEDLSGETLGGRFLLEHRIADGGSGTVWFGRDLDRDREPVAVKIIRSPEAGASSRWQAELKALERLSHVGIVQPRGGGIVELGPYLATDYIEGVTLQSALARGQVSREWIWLRVWEICDALEYAHRRGVLHCDLKPNNIMIRHYGGRGESSVLIDFGVAILRQREGSITLGPNAAGALDYMAPEQLGGRISEATDIYSLAAVLFEALTGVRWRLADSTGQWEAELAEFPDLIPVFRTALEFDPKQRYNSVAEFRSALRAAQK